MHQKNRFFGFPDSQLRSVSGQIIAVVERDEELFAARMHPESNLRSIGNDHLTMKQRQSGATTGPPTLSE